MRAALAALAIVAAPAVAQDARDRDTLLAMIKHWDMAWQSGDATLGAFDYAPDAIWIDVKGRRARGKPAIETVLKAAFERDPAAVESGKHIVAFHHRNAAQVTSTAGAEVHERVFRRGAERWEIVAHTVHDAKAYGSSRRLSSRPSSSVDARA